jgi:uncharacterized coiled-coil protein SlyX
MPTTLEQLEARVAVLEARQADYQAVLTVVNALGVQTREQFDRVHARIDKVEQKLEQHTERFDSVDEHLAELKDLIIGLHDR